MEFGAVGAELMFVFDDAGAAWDVDEPFCA